MSPIEKDVLIRKLGITTDNLKLLEIIHEMDRKLFLQDVYKRKAAERLLQELIEAAIDINIHLLVEAGKPAPDDSFSSFVKLAECGILPLELAEQLAPSAGLRNRLVHEYDVLNYDLILKAIGLVVTIYPRYVKAINEYVEARS